LTPTDELLEEAPKSAHPIDWSRRSWRWLHGHAICATIILLATAVVCGILSAN
jgi:hypothetical protein